MEGLLHVLLFETGHVGGGEGKGATDNERSRVDYSWDGDDNAIVQEMR